MKVRGGVSSVLLALLPACAALGNGEPSADWKEIEVAAPSETVLFKLALLTVESLGYPIAGGTDPHAGVIVSGWKTSLAPFKGEGYRLRAELEVEPVGSSRFKVRAHVQKQTNEALVNPLDPSRAEWEWTGDDPVQAEVLLQHVRSAVEPARAPSETGGG